MGTYYSKSAYESDPKIPSICLNLFSKRLTPSFVAFKSQTSLKQNKSSLLNENEIKNLIPVIGEQAQTILQTQPWAGSGYLQHFIDINDDESRNSSSKLGVTSPNDTHFKLFNLTTTFLHFYSKMMLKSDFDMTPTTLIVPGDFTTPQINWLTDASMHARLKNVKTLFDWEAIANMYAQRRPDIIQKRGKKIMFIDVGATSTKAYTIKFDILKGLSKYSAKLLSYHIDHDTGGAYITHQLSHFIQHRIAPGKELSYSEKAKIIEIAENAKCKLSLLPKIEISIDDVLGQDFKLNITTDDLNNVASDQIQRIIQCISLEFKQTKPDFIEIIGGSSRITKFKNELSKLIFPIKFGNSLNADESLALGGEYYSISPYVQTQMNVSFYGVSMCEYMFCHDLLLGTGTDLGFKDNPEVIYFNITTPLRRGIMSYNWSYYLHKPMKGFTNYMFFKRNPVEFLNAQQCYASSCKNQTAILISPNYGNFISILEVEENNRKYLGFLTNSLEEKFYYIKKRTDLIEMLNLSQQNEINKLCNEVENYLYSNSFSKQQTTQYTSEIDKVTSLLHTIDDFLLKKDQLKDVIERSNYIVNVIYPQSKGWLSDKIISALNVKINHAQQFYHNITTSTTIDQIDDECSALTSWLNSLPHMQKLPERGKLMAFFFSLGNRIFDIILVFLKKYFDYNF